MSTRPLTIRGVKTMLTRSGIDTSALTFERFDRSSVHDGGMFDGLYVEWIEVRVSGPEPIVSEASRAMFDRGLSITPFGEYVDVMRWPPDTRTAQL